MGTDIEKKNIVLKAVCGSLDRPLKIDDIEIPCFVLEDETRVLTQAGLQKGIGMSKSGSHMAGVRRLSKLIARFSSKIPELNVVTARIEKPIEFQPPWGGRTALGYEATILADICDAVLAARKVRLLHKQQEHIADRCEILMRGFARVGIIALVDEATGYQDIRGRLALQKILDKYLLDYKAAWAKRFPDDFYRGIFRLKKWPYDPSSIKRPSIIGTMTNDIVYARLAPGILDELKERTPKDERGRRKFRFHQWFTEDIGHPKLQEHLVKVMTLLDASPNYAMFHRLLQRAIPKIGETLPLDIPEE
jgi:hypothetical protein